ncbi:MAG: hypothetical protein JNM69_28910 [Archangium sp.]|nr:hypothetical protein [Archangium sp.]
MHVALPPLRGSYGLEWLVKVGERVETGQVLAWLAVADHCALVPLEAPGSGVITSRWSELISSAPAGVVVAAIDGDDGSCEAAERRTLELERRVVVERLVAIERKAGHPTAAALLEPERRRLTTWLADCDQLLTRESD